MLSRRVFGSVRHLNNVYFLKVYFQSCPRRYIVSNNELTSTPHEDDKEGDFFGITENDLCNKTKTFPSGHYLNEKDFSKEVILSKHLFKDVRHNDMEKNIITTFGKIRFDWQNTVPSNVEISQKVKENQRSNREEEDYFSEKKHFAFNLGGATATLENSITTLVDSNQSTIKSGDSDDAKDIDFMNSQDFANYGKKITDNPNFFDANAVNFEETFPYDNCKLFDLEKNPSNNGNVIDDCNFIESQYFPHPSEKVKNESRTTTPTIVNTNNDESNLPENNSNFIEEFYFPSNNDCTRSENNPVISQSKQQKGRLSKCNFTTNSKLENAFEASQEIRREIKNKQGTTHLDSKGFRILKGQVYDLSQLTIYEIANHLKSRILYNKNDLIVINKPYGLSSHGGPGINVSVAQVLSELAKKIHHSGKIHLIHRLDKETTGVMLLAKTDKTAYLLKDMFKERQVIKTYWAMTKGIPSPSKGIIDIPIAEGTVNGRHRMVLKPRYNEEMPFMKKSRVKSHEAITHYEVLNSSYNCALVQCKTETGVKHQVRVHLAFGLNTPILGDHKYSHLTKMAPQRLFPEILERLHIRQSKVRHVPMHLHAVSMILPEAINGQNLSFKAPLPYNFCQNMKRLKFRK